MITKEDLAAAQATIDAELTDLPTLGASADGHHPGNCAPLQTNQMERKLPGAAPAIAAPQVVCAWCKRWKHVDGSWGAEFGKLGPGVMLSHGLCPDCYAKQMKLVKQPANEIIQMREALRIVREEIARNLSTAVQLAFEQNGGKGLEDELCHLLRESSDLHDYLLQAQIGLRFKMFSAQSAKRKAQ